MYFRMKFDVARLFLAAFAAAFSASLLRAEENSVAAADIFPADTVLILNLDGLSGRIGEYLDSPDGNKALWDGLGRFKTGCEVFQKYLELGEVKPNGVLVPGKVDSVERILRGALPHLESLGAALFSADGKYVWTAWVGLAENSDAVLSVFEKERDSFGDGGAGIDGVKSALAELDSGPSPVSIGGGFVALKKYGRIFFFMSRAGADAFLAMRDSPEFESLGKSPALGRAGAYNPHAFLFMRDRKSVV